MNTFLIASILLGAGLTPPDFSTSPKIGIQNSVLIQVNESTISMMDVKKQLDLFFHQHYAHLEGQEPARFQFYEASWRRVLLDLIDNELIVADATDKGIKLTDGEIREEMEARFGPNVLSTLDRIGITYDEAWKMLKKEMIVRRMNWWFVQSKAIQSVTPSDIRRSYQEFIKENPPYQELSYRIISIKSDNPEKCAAKVQAFIQKSHKNLDLIEEEITAIDPSIQISQVYTASDLQISESHKLALSNLEPNSYSEPLIQSGRDQKKTARIFYLISKEDHTPASFEDSAAKLKENLVQLAMMKESQGYLNKLRKHYGFDGSYLKERFPEDLHPFSLQ